MKIKNLTLRNIQILSGFFSVLPHVPVVRQASASTVRIVLSPAHVFVLLNLCANSKFVCRVLTCICRTHTCQLFLFNRNCPYFDPRKWRKKSDFIMCSYFCKYLPVVLYRIFRNVPIFKDIPPICPYILGFRVGKYEDRADMLG